MHCMSTIFVRFLHGTNSESLTILSACSNEVKGDNGNPREREIEGGSISQGSKGAVRSGRASLC